MKVYVTDTSAELFSEDRRIEFDMPAGWRVPCPGEDVVMPKGDMKKVYSVVWHVPPSAEVDVHIG